MLETTIRLDLRDLQEALAALTGKLPGAIQAAVRASIESIIRDAVQNRMSAPSPGPFPLLGVVTGAARRSVRSSAGYSATQDRVTGQFGSSLEYVKAHEFGFHGPVAVRAHARRVLRHTALRTGKRLKRPQDTGRSGMVRAHTRIANIRARRMFLESLRAEIPRIEPRIRRALEILISSKRLPLAGELGLG